MVKTQAFVIHLERAAGRRAQAESIMQRVGCESELLAACDGKLLSQEALDQFYPGHAIFQPSYPFKLSPVEIGCFQSHRTAWAKIVDKNLDAGIVFEDDVEIDEDVFQAALAFAQNHIEQFGYIQFQVRELPNDCRVVFEKDKVGLYEPTVVPLRASAQLISRKAAQRLLAVTEQIDRPIDTFVQMHWLTKVAVGCVAPSGASDRTVETGGSTLSRKRSLVEKLRAEVLRARYRYTIKKQSHL